MVLAAGDADGTTKLLGVETAGVNGTPGHKGQMGYDANYIYVCTADSTIETADVWKRAAIGWV